MSNTAELLEEKLAERERLANASMYHHTRNILLNELDEEIAKLREQIETEAPPSTDEPPP